jgi:hypothetical protein
MAQNPRRTAKGPIAPSKPKKTATSLNVPMSPFDCLGLESSVRLEEQADERDSLVAQPANPKRKNSAARRQSGYIPS